MREEAGAVFDRPHLLIRRREVNPSEAGEGNGPRAHGARLQRHMEIAGCEPFGAQYMCGLADRQHLGMGGGVFQFERAVASPGDNLAREIGDDGTHRNLTPGRCGFSFGESDLHGGWQFQSHRAT